MAKTVIITGGSGGIGGACAHLFAQEGYAVVIGYLTGEARARALEILASGGEASAFAADVRVSACANAMIAFALAAYGRLDALVCAAGTSLFSLAQDTTDEQCRAVFDANVFGTMNVCRAAIPPMVGRKAGTIVTISSMWGEVGSAGESAYSASKAAVIGYSKALAKELGPSGITVNSVAPGLIDTAMNASLSQETLDVIAEETPLGRQGSPEEIAGAVYLLASSGFITGQVLDVSGGLVIT
ncbi:MAG: SDR family oxidoreductase [Oscillospiraceae bacterium]